MKKLLHFLTLFLGVATIANAQAPANDSCTAAISLTVGAACVNGTNVNATDDKFEKSVWYKFTATGVATKVSLTNVSNGLDAGILVVRDGCIADELIGFADFETEGAAETANFSTVIGDEYYIAIAPNPSGSFLSGTYCIAVDETVAPPANDEPQGLVYLTPGAACVDGTTVNAWTVPQLVNNVYRNDVWYGFNAGSDSSSVSVTNVGAGLDAAIIVFDTLDNTLNNIVASADNALSGGLNETVSFSTVAGKFYAIAIFGYKMNPEGLFCISVKNESATSSINTPGNITAVSVYPNPANNQIQILNNQGAKFDQINITDISGRLVLSLNATDKINIQQLSQGAYFIQLTNQGVLAGTTRFIKN